MAVEKFKNQNSQGGDQKDTEEVFKKWTNPCERIESEENSKWFSEDLPNQPSLIDVEVRKVSKLEYINDEEFAYKLAEKLNMRDSHKMSFAIKTIYNDMTVWFWPFRQIQGGKNSILSNVLKKKIRSMKEFKKMLKTGEEDVEVEDVTLSETEQREWMKEMEYSGTDQQIEDKNTNEDENDQTWMDW